MTMLTSSFKPDTESTVSSMHFAPFKCRMILQGWQRDYAALTLCKGRLEIVNSFVYLESFMSASGAKSH